MFTEPDMKHEVIQRAQVGSLMAANSNKELQNQFSSMQLDSTLSATAQPFQPRAAPQSSQEDDAP